MNDLKFAFRQLFNNPGFTAVAVLTLALGIGANTAIFTVINSVLLRPLPYAEPERIVRLAPDWPNTGFTSASESKFNFWRDHARSFEAVAAVQSVGSGVNLAGGNEREFMSGLRVSLDFFLVLQINPALGRGFTREETSPGGEGVVVLSDGLWRRRFGAEPTVVGKTILLNDEPCTVVGVMPPDFWFLVAADVFVPMRTNPASRDQGHNYRVLARLKPGVTPSQAAGDMRRVFEQFKDTYPNMLWRDERGIRSIVWNLMLGISLALGVWDLGICPADHAP